MLPKAILFDMDDTIIAFEQGVDVDACWKNVCRKYMPELNDERLDHTVKSIKATAKWFWSDAERHRIGRLDLDKARTEIVHTALTESIPLHVDQSQSIAVDYGVERDRAVTLFPGAVETLRTLADSGIKLALITNGASLPQRKKIERFELAPYFQTIIIEEEFGAGKPDSRVYEYALTELGVRADETWMIGDNWEWEVAAPHKLGIKGLWLNHKAVAPADPTIPFQAIAAIRDILHMEPFAAPAK